MGGLGAQVKDDDQQKSRSRQVNQSSSQRTTGERIVFNGEQRSQVSSYMPHLEEELVPKHDFMGMLRGVVNMKSKAVVVNQNGEFPGALPNRTLIL